MTQDWFFTFGAGHTHPQGGAPLSGRYVRIHGTCDSTRAEMFRVFGNRWAFQYSTDQAPSCVFRRNLTEVPLDRLAAGLTEVPLDRLAAGLALVDAAEAAHDASADPDHHAILDDLIRDLRRTLR